MGIKLGVGILRWILISIPNVQGVHIFDLAITAKKLAEAMEFVRDLTAQGKEVAFVGTKRQASSIVKEEAEKCKAPYAAVRWLGGTMTNWEQIKRVSIS